MICVFLGLLVFQNKKQFSKIVDKQTLNFIVAKFDLQLGCRGKEGPSMRVDSVLELVWCLNWVHNCSFSQHDVSSQTEFYVGLFSPSA